MLRDLIAISLTVYFDVAAFRLDSPSSRIVPAPLLHLGEDLSHGTRHDSDPFV